MKQYRVTKYDPQYRNDQGAFTKDDWTSFDDIGTIIDGHLVTESEYVQVENAYIETAIRFLREANIATLLVYGMENKNNYPTPASEGLALTLDELRGTFKNLLRGHYWCRFEMEGKGFVHFGWDYYMYVGVSTTCRRSIQYAKEHGLFVEEFTSPYHKEKAEGPTPGAR